MSIKKKIIVFSLLLSLPVSIFFILWAYNTVNIYFKIDHHNLFTNVMNRGVRLQRIGLMEFVELRETLYHSLGLYKKSEVNIFLKNSDLMNLNSDLPKSSFKDKKAFLFIDNKIIKGKARYRGDSFYHWLWPHKSWRFKTSKNDLYNGVRKYNFIIPKSTGILGNHISYRLAKLMGLLAPDSSMKSLSINNKYNGIKLMVEQIDESFLRNNNRMPNDIYKGDNVGLARNVGLRVSSIFDEPAIWDKVSINNHYEKESKMPLKKLFKDLNKTKNNLMDRESFSGFMAFVDLTSSFHSDAQHNWIFYYDNYYEKFYPIVWDTVGWTKKNLDKKSVNINNGSRLFESLYNDYEFLRSKYYVMYDFFSAKEKIFFQVLDSEIDEIKRKVELSGYYGYTVYGKYKNSSEIIEGANKFRQIVKDRFTLVKKNFVSGVNQSDYKYALNNNILRLSVSGNKLINKISIDVLDANNMKHIYLSYKQKGNIKQVMVPFSIINNNKVSLDVNLLANAVQVKDKSFSSTSIEYKETTYDIEIEGANIDDIESVYFSFLTLDPKTILVNKVFDIKMTEFGNQKNIIKKINIQNKQVWSGTKLFSGFNLIKDDIDIEPGTKIIFEENTTVKILGKVTAFGTKENPISFEAKDSTKPWNSLVLKDEKANGSVFKYCIFKDGSGDKGDLYEYTAMFSVHNVKDLLVENCEFYNSHRTDDMVHVIYSKATFKNTRFVNSLSDALDVDLSDLIVDNCKFIDSGNDSIDLMTTNAIVINTEFLNSKDKGISIGEGSNLLAINNLIKGSEIGMQSKDTSMAYIYNSSFIENKKAIDAYHKNWRYSEGGTIYLDKCVFKENVINVTVGKKSKVTINDSEINGVFDKKLLKKKLVLSELELIEPDFPNMPISKFLDNINNSHRGFYGN